MCVLSGPVHRPGLQNCTPPIFLKCISHLPIRSRTISQTYLDGATVGLHTPLPNHVGNLLKNHPPRKTFRLLMGCPVLSNRRSISSNRDHLCLFWASSQTWFAKVHPQYFWNGSATCLLGPGHLPKLSPWGHFGFAHSPANTFWKFMEKWLPLQSP